MLQTLEIRRSSAVDQVVAAVCEMILRGDLAPGTPLREAALADSAGVSRNTIRDAVRVLAREGLVKHTMNRGAIVTQLRERDIRDIFRVRRALELQAIEARPEATEEQVAALEGAVRDLRRAVEGGEQVAIVQADCRFHQRLVAFLGSARLDRFFEAIQGEMRLCLAIVDRVHEDENDLVDEHQELYELIAAGEIDRSTALLGAHLDDGRDRLCRIARGSVGDTSEGEEIA